MVFPNKDRDELMLPQHVPECDVPTFYLKYRTFSFRTVQFGVLQY